MFFEDIDYDYKAITEIRNFLAEYNIDLSSQYPNTNRYLKIKEYELTDTKNYFKDLHSLINICKNKLPFNIYSQLITNLKDKHVENQLSQVYASVKQLLSEQETAKYNYIEKIQDKHLLLSGFDIKNFLQEKKELYNKLSKEIFNTDLLYKTISQTKFRENSSVWFEVKNKKEIFKYKWLDSFLRNSERMFSMGCNKRKLQNYRRKRAWFPYLAYSSKKCDEPSWMS